MSSSSSGSDYGRRRNRGKIHLPKKVKKKELKKQIDSSGKNVFSSADASPGSTGYESISKKLRRRDPGSTKRRQVLYSLSSSNTNRKDSKKLSDSSGKNVFVNKNVSSDSSDYESISKKIRRRDRSITKWKQAFYSSSLSDTDNQQSKKLPESSGKNVPANKNAISDSSTYESISKRLRRKDRRSAERDEPLYSLSVSDKESKTQTNSKKVPENVMDVLSSSHSDEFLPQRASRPIIKYQDTDTAESEPILKQSDKKSFKQMQSPLIRHQKAQSTFINDQDQQSLHISDDLSEITVENEPFKKQKSTRTSKSTPIKIKTVAETEITKSLKEIRIVIPEHEQIVPKRLKLTPKSNDKTNLNATFVKDTENSRRVSKRIQLSPTPITDQQVQVITREEFLKKYKSSQETTSISKKLISENKSSEMNLDEIIRSPRNRKKRTLRKQDKNASVSEEALNNLPLVIIETPKKDRTPLRSRTSSQTDNKIITPTRKSQRISRNTPMVVIPTSVMNLKNFNVDSPPKNPILKNILDENSKEKGKRSVSDKQSSPRKLTLENHDEASKTSKDSSGTVHSSRKDTLENVEGNLVHKISTSKSHEEHHASRNPERSLSEISSGNNKVYRSSSRKEALENLDEQNRVHKTNTPKSHEEHQVSRNPETSLSEISSTSNKVYRSSSRKDTLENVDEGNLVHKTNTPKSHEEHQVSRSLEGNLSEISSASNRGYRSSSRKQVSENLDEQNLVHKTNTPKTHDEQHASRSLEGNLREISSGSSKSYRRSSRKEALENLDEQNLVHKTNTPKSHEGHQVSRSLEGNLREISSGSSKSYRGSSRKEALENLDEQNLVHKTNTPKTHEEQHASRSLEGNLRETSSGSSKSYRRSSRKKALENLDEQNLVHKTNTPKSHEGHQVSRSLEGNLREISSGSSKSYRSSSQKEALKNLNEQNLVHKTNTPKSHEGHQVSRSLEGNLSEISSGSNKGYPSSSRKQASENHDEQNLVHKTHTPKPHKEHQVSRSPEGNLSEISATKNKVYRSSSRKEALENVDEQSLIHKTPISKSHEEHQLSGNPERNSSQISLASNKNYDNENDRNIVQQKEHSNSPSVIEHDIIESSASQRSYRSSLEPPDRTRKIVFKSFNRLEDYDDDVHLLPKQLKELSVTENPQNKSLLTADQSQNRGRSSEILRTIEQDWARSDESQKSYRSDTRAPDDRKESSAKGKESNRTRRTVKSVSIVSDSSDEEYLFDSEPVKEQPKTSNDTKTTNTTDKVLKQTDIQRYLEHLKKRKAAEDEKFQQRMKELEISEPKREIKKIPIKKKVTRKPPNPQAEVLKELLTIDGKRYRRPKQFKKLAYWVTPILQSKIVKKLSARYEEPELTDKANDLIEQLVNTVKIAQKRKTYPIDVIENFKIKLASESFIETNFDFHTFVNEYVPRQYWDKLIPIVVPGTNKTSVPFEPSTIFLKILD